MRIKMPAVRIAQAEVEMQQDTDVLTCGACQKAFALGDIVKFIQHKILACNKENYGCNESASANHSGADSDGEVGLVTRRPSISAPMKRSELGPSEPRCSTPKRRPSPSASASPTPITAELDSTPPSVSSPEEGPCKKLRTDVADATSNTTNSEPSNYVCSTCKARLHSAWRLVQHVQNSHGIKIYVENSSSVSMSSLGSSPGTSAGKNHSSSSTCSSGSPGCSSAPPTTPLALPPPTVTSSRLPSPLIDPHLPLHNPFTVGGLLRMPLEPTRHHQFAPGSLSGGSLFARPSSHTEHHFRMEQLVSEQFRHHPLGFAAAVAAGVPPPPFGPERPPPTTRSLPPPPPSLAQSPLEPQIDFYSQRLRQLAGTTSPGAANGNSSPSPRKLTPPFTSPSNIPTTVSMAPSLMFNNNNNSSTNNNNITTARSPTPRTQQSSPPVEQKPAPPAQPSSAEPAVEETVDLTSTPRSASTPPVKPEFSDNAASESMDVSDPNKIHPCEYCGKKFRFQSNLLVHKRSHTGEKPYKCSVCNHACSQSSKLRRHMKVHKRSRSKTSCGEDGNPNGSGSVNSTPDQMSNAGSVETLDDDEDDDDDIDDDEDEEEDEEDEEEMEMEEEEGDEDDDLGGDAPEDLTTKSTSSTPPNSGDPKGGSGSPHPDKTSSGSLVGELMDKFGLNNIQQYSEAYKAALQESVGAHHLITRKDDLLHRSHLMDNNNSGSKPSSRLENGLLEKSALRFREEFAKNMITGQPQLDLVGGPHGIFGPTFENPFDASKRAKLDGRDLRPSDRDMYAGLWFPGLSGHHRDQIFGGNGADSDILKDKKGPTTPGPSLAAAAAAAALNLGLTSQGMKKDSRRNDTCEFCGKVFKNCSNLTVHRRSHTGEKPYKCELCSYACAQSSKLTRHMKTHGRMGKDVYRCRFCEMPFSVPSTLEKHMRKCVVNQNIKVEHMLPSMMSGDEDSAASTPKDTAST